MIRNPLSEQNFSDPFITYDKKTGYYYCIGSCQCNTITIYRSRKIEDILKNGEKKNVFSCGEKQVFGPLWAPEMYKFGNKWYIYTSCREKWHDDLFAEKKHLLILESEDEDPFNGFHFGSIPDPETFAIDPTVSIIDGKLYICYSEVVKEIGQVLVIREMKDPLTFTEKHVMISKATLPWELAEGYEYPHTINEGAYFLKKGNRLFIIYSANGCWSDDYCLGVLEHTGGEICDADHWIKHPAPIFEKGNGAFGVGHASFFESPDETEIWCAYHCLLRSNPNREEMDRHTCVQKIEFDDTCYPIMGAPVGVDLLIASPSGE